MCAYMSVYVCYLLCKFELSAGAIEYTDFFFGEGSDLTPTSVQDMTLNNLMVRFQ